MEAFSLKDSLRVLVTLFILCQLSMDFLDSGADGKSIGRSWTKNVGGGRTYLKKFGKRSVVYHRKIFNTKYKTSDDVGDIGTVNNEKFKRRLSDGAPFLSSRSSSSSSTTLDPDTLFSNSTTTTTTPIHYGTR